MEYICIAVILGIFGGIYNSPIFCISIIITGSIIYIFLKIFDKKINYYNFDRNKINKYLLKKVMIMLLVSIITMLIIIGNENRIDTIYEKDSKNNNREYIVSVTDKKEGKNRNIYNIIFKSINGEKYIRINGRISAKKKLELGKDYVIIGRLEKYKEERNYMGFNQRLYMYSRSNYFKIIEHEEKIEEYISSKKNYNFGERLCEIYNDTAKQVLSGITRYRIKHRKVLEKYVKNNYLLEGIIVGDIDNVDEEIKERFKDINSYHLLAISGSHMAYLVTIIEFFVKRVKAGKNTSNILTIVIIGMYIILAGFSPAVLRAGISAIIIAFLRINRIKTNTSYYFSLSILTLFLIFPYMVTDVRNILIIRRSYWTNNTEIRL